MSTVRDVRSDTTLVVLKGSDPVLVNEAVLAVQSLLVGDEDPTLVLDVIGADRLRPPDRDPDLGPLVDAAQTMPFLTDRRVVVGRGLGAFTRKEDVASLVAYLADPLPSTALVLVYEKAPDQVKAPTPPKSLTDAVKAVGGVIIDVGPGNKVAEWARAELQAAPVELDRAATDLVVDSIGEDAARLGSILQALVGAYGEGTRLTEDQVSPYLIEAGGVAPWDLTDAIDRGDVPASLAVLERMLRGGGRHPLQILATLHGHYQKMMALDGLGVADERGAAAVLGIKGSTFPARKALEQGRRLGPARLAEMMGLLAQADLDLKGSRSFGWPGGGEAVMEVLVARLASRSSRGRGRGAGATRSGSGRR